MGTVLVVENAPEWHLGRIATWLSGTDLEPVVVRPHRGEDLSATGHDAIIALGGGRDAAWEPQLTRVLTSALADGTPTLAFCSSARALAVALGGAVDPVTEFRPGPRLIARRDAAANDPLFGTAPMALDVVCWRHQELTDLPPDALLLAATPDGAPEVFRVGERAWGLQSHIEFDSAMIAALGGDADLGHRVDMIGEHLEATWRPVIDRFAALAAGRVAGTPLPLLDRP